MSIRVYTWKSEPFMIGGTGRFICADIEEYERVNIGKGYFACVFQNSAHKQWHVALENCGALIMSAATKKTAIKTVKEDVRAGDPKLMEQQVEKGRKDCKSASVLSTKEFFSLLKGP